jgi:light-regulated signal transduction histidine kinase (bacteriophytochrome)
LHDLEKAHADKSLIKQVFINLISNGVKYSGKKSHPQIIVKCENGKEGTTYSVKDNGVGFDMEYSSKLFGVFQRLHSENDFPGTGVGLANAARIVHRHGGRIWASSVPDEGAEFFFTIPLKEMPETAKK